MARRPRAYKKYKQGVFKPIHPKKYTGTTPILYRSSYELKFMRWADSNSNVISWGSESVIVPYISPKDGKLHRYFVDNNVTIKNKNGNLKKYLIEIKPYKQTQPPKTKNRKNKKSLLYEQYTFAVNQAKWEAATAWAKKHDYEFIILTEKDLNKNK